MKLSMQDTIRDLSTTQFASTWGTAHTASFAVLKAAFPVLHQVFKLAYCGRENHCSGIDNSVMFLKGWRWSMHAL